VLFLASVVPGCGGSSEDASAPASESASSAEDFDGRYVADGPGDIAAIEFHSPNYSLTPATCRSASCVEAGRYSIDSARGTISLKTSSTGAERTLTLVVLESRPFATSAPASVDVNRLEPRDDLVAPSKGSVVSPPRDLVREEIIQALMAGRPISKQVPPDRGAPVPAN
jgi:hypothetical protein